ncbi:MAG: hypothetical protein FD181_1708 [Prolixibacteraceae bacterium]|nr:MAG: hypothetical protein FD181_1708 [Prolixibacteraceae bacterium]
MLKKASHIILSALLLISSIGLVVSKHYCRNDLISIAFDKEAGSCCGNADCCHHENQYYNLEEDYSMPQISNVPVLAEFVIIGIELMPEFLSKTQKSKHTILVFTDSPPPPKIQKTLALKQLYRL